MLLPGCSMTTTQPFAMHITAITHNRANIKLSSNTFGACGSPNGDVLFRPVTERRLHNHDSPGIDNQQSPLGRNLKATLTAYANPVDVSMSALTPSTPYIPQYRPMSSKLLASRSALAKNTTA